MKSNAPFSRHKLRFIRFFEKPIELRSSYEVSIILGILHEIYETKRRDVTNYSNPIDFYSRGYSAFARGNTKKRLVLFIAIINVRDIKF